MPRGFTKIRTYGYLANRNRRERINPVMSKMKLSLHLRPHTNTYRYEIEGIIWDKYEGVWDLSQKYDGVMVSI
jgi:hypothetical protein